MAVSISATGTSYLRSISMTSKRPTGSLLSSSSALQTYSGETRTLDSIVDAIDTETIEAAYNAEGFFRRVVNRYSELIWKRGITFKGADSSAVSWVEKRLLEIEEHSGKPLKLILMEIVHEYLLYGNAFLFKYRTKSIPVSGRIWLKNKKKIQPIVSLIGVPSKEILARLKHTNTKTVVDKFIVKTTNGTYLSLSPDHTIHFKIYNGPGNVFGNPMVGPVLADIRSLRRMEENVELLVFNYSIPFYHVTIGNEVDQISDDVEFELAKARIDDMPLNGIFISDWRYEVKAVDTRNATIEIEPYLEYFKKRILGTLGSSVVELGEGDTSNRSTSLTISRITQEVAKFFQTTLEEFINFYLIREIQFEGGYTIKTPEDKVICEFPEIDLDQLIALDSHYTNLFNNQGIDIDEYRTMLKKQPYSKKQHTKLQNTLFAKVPDKTSDNKVHPENQHEKKTSPGNPQN